MASPRDLTSRAPEFAANSKPAGILAGAINNLVNRRSVMTLLSSAAALTFATAAPSPSIASGAPKFSCDEEVLDVARQIFERLPKFRQARDARDAAEEAFTKRMPAEPDALLWRMGDPVCRSYDVMRDGRCYLVCDFDQIEQRKTKPRVLWEFVGTEEEHQTTKAEDFDELGYPAPHVAHFWKAKVDKNAVRRQAELVAALDRYRSDCSAIRSELQVEELDEEFNTVFAEVGGMVEHLIALRAFSLEGLRAKAAVLAQHLVEIHLDSTLDGDAYDMVRSMVMDLGGDYPFEGAPGAALARSEEIAA
jgi:hypothetical protein